MKVEFDHQNLEQIDTIKKAIKLNFESLGFDNRPEEINDKLALEFALSFTYHYIHLKNFDSSIKQKA